MLDEDGLTRAIVALATQYGRYGYRRIAALLRGAGGPVGKDRGAADLAAGGAESAAKAKTPGTIVAE